MKKFRFKIQDNIYDVAVESLEQQQLELNVNGKKYSVELEEEAAPSKKNIEVENDKKPTPPKKDVVASPAAPGKSGSTRITAPLPGSIVRIIATEGSMVKTGDVLLIMESMKMENNILADTDGCIKRIHVAAGQTVMQDDTLVEIG